MMNSDFVQNKIIAGWTCREPVFSRPTRSGDLKHLLRNPESASVQRGIPTLTALTSERPAGEARRRVLQDLMWTLLNSREFLFNH